MLGVGFVAVRRIPCYCVACVKKVASKWQSNKDIYNQDRYIGDNPNCIYWDILGSYNNWKIIKCIDKVKDKSKEDDEIIKVKQCAIQHMTNYFEELIQVGDYAAISTTDRKAESGYYLVRWLSEPYTLQEQKKINYNEIFQAGEVVCKAKYLNSFVGKKQWFTPYTDKSGGETLIRMSTVVSTRLQVSSIEEMEPSLKWSNILMRQALSLKAVYVSVESHDEILEAIFAREEIDHNESIELHSDSDCW